MNTIKTIGFALIAGVFASVASAEMFNGGQINNLYDTAALYGRLQEMKADCQRITAQCGNGGCGVGNQNMSMPSCNVVMPAPNQFEIMRQNRIFQLMEDSQQLARRIDANAKARNDELRARVGEEEYQRIRAETYMERLNASLDAQLEAGQKRCAWNAQVAKERARTRYYKKTGEKFKPETKFRPNDSDPRQEAWDYTKSIYNIYKNADK